MSDVLHAIISNIQDIISSELKLAKTELREEAAKLRPIIVLLAISTVGAVFGLMFIFLSAMFALSLWVPYWAAASIIGTLLIVVAGLGFRSSFARMSLPQVPVTTQVLKENLQWSNQPIK